MDGCVGRLLTFVLALVAWWGASLMLSGGPGALPYVLFFGSFYALPMAIYAAFADGWATFFFPKHAMVGFLAIVGVGLACLVAFSQLGAGAAVNKPFHTLNDAKSLLTGIGIPTAALIAVYVIANLMREPNSG
jgi:hypothetical protein